MLCCISLPKIGVCGHHTIVFGKIFHQYRTASFDGTVRKGHIVVSSLLGGFAAGVSSSTQEQYHTDKHCNDQ